MFRYIFFGLHGLQLSMTTANRKVDQLFNFFTHVQPFLEFPLVKYLQTWQLWENCFGKHFNRKSLKLHLAVS